MQASPADESSFVGVSATMASKTRRIEITIHAIAQLITAPSLRNARNCNYLSAQTRRTICSCGRPEDSIMRRFSMVVFICILAAGCATQYRPSDESITGGFSETQLAPDTWRVLVEGNSFTSRRHAEQFLMRRCAELALEQGKRYFVLGDHNAWMNVHRTKSGVAAWPINRAEVTVVSERDRDTFDAVDIIERTNAAAGGRLSARARRTFETFKDSVS